MKAHRDPNARDLRASLPAGVFLSALACVPMASATSGNALLPTDPVQVPAPLRAWTAAGEICVRLARFESMDSLIVDGARGASDRVVLARSGASITVNGEALDPIGSRYPARECWIEARDPQLGLALGGARYAGRLRIRPLSAATAQAGSGLAVDNVVDLEDYVAGVLAGEVQLLAAAPAELEAQAIASRSFALAQLAARGSRSLEVRLSDTIRDQVYAGKFTPTRDPRSGQAARVLAEALQRTRGMILVEGDATLDARFHAACGGRTANAADVFPEAAHFEALRGVDCRACLNELGPQPASGAPTLPASIPDLSWRTTLTRGDLDRLARDFTVGEHVLRLEPVRRDRTGRWLEVELVGSSSSRRVSFESVRKALKQGAIGSNLVLVSSPRGGETIEAGLMLTGRGRGHGVGLCQNGSHQFALRGWSSAQILAHYYPGTTLVDGR